MSEKVVFHQFDPVIYPFKLWVVISNNLKEISNTFVGGKDWEELDFSDIKRHVDAFIFDEYVTHKETLKNGFLVVFRHKRTCTVSVATHEASHLSEAIWKYLSEKKHSKGEPQAYLIEWIVDCILKAKTKKSK